jgi:hypothetical protein
MTLQAPIFGAVVMTAPVVGIVPAEWASDNGDDAK